MKKGIVINKLDNVATLLDDAKIGDNIVLYDMENNIVDSLISVGNIPYGNKIATKDILNCEDVFKYGEKIGKAIIDIQKYELVHVHNIKSYSIDIPESVKKEVIRKMDIK